MVSSGVYFTSIHRRVVCPVCGPFFVPPYQMWLRLASSAERAFDPDKDIPYLNGQVGPCLSSNTFSPPISKRIPSSANLNDYTQVYIVTGASTGVGYGICRSSAPAQRLQNRDLEQFRRTRTRSHGGPGARRRYFSHHLAAMQSWCSGPTRWPRSYERRSCELMG